MSQAGKLFDGTILPDIETLTGNSGGAVGPTGGNINVVGDGTTIDITGNPGTSTLTASFIGSTDITITGDTGGAQTGDSFTFDGGTTGLSFDGAANVFTTTFAGITANGGTVALATDATASTVNIGTGAGAKTVQLGSTDTTSSLALRYGTSDFTLASATGTVMNALDTGEITYPLQPAFLAYLGTSDTNTTGAGTTFTLGSATALTEIYDQNNDFATDTFTAPITGKYLFTSRVRMAALTVAMTSSQILISTSNRTYNGGYFNPGAIMNASNQATLEINSFADMDAGDTARIQITIFNGAGNIATVGGAGATALISFFAGKLEC